MAQRHALHVERTAEKAGPTPVQFQSDICWGSVTCCSLCRWLLRRTPNLRASSRARTPPRSAFLWARYPCRVMWWSWGRGAVFDERGTASGGGLAQARSGMCSDDGASSLLLYYSRPRVGWYKRLRALNTSPPRNCFPLLRSSCSCIDMLCIDRWIEKYFQGLKI